MYIKIKYLKFAILSFSCMLFASINYYAYVKADSSSASDSSTPSADANATQDSLTSTVTQNLAAFIKSKGTQPITTDDIKNFTDSQVADQMGDPLTFDNLPQVDTSNIKILKQPYSTLSDADRKTKERTDAQNYISNILYLLINNAPTQIATKDDANTFYQDFLSKLNDPSSNQAYFTDLGNRLSLLNEQLADIEVPETMLDLHVKFLRLIAETLSIKNMTPISDADPIGGQVTLAKAKEIVDLFTDFLSNDVSNYFKALN